MATKDTVVNEILEYFDKGKDDPYGAETLVTQMA